MNTRKTRAMRRGGRSQRPRAATERGGTREAATHAGRVGGGTYALSDHARRRTPRQLRRQARGTRASIGDCHVRISGILKTDHAVLQRCTNRHCALFGKGVERKTSNLGHADRPVLLSTVLRRHAAQLLLTLQ